MLELQNIETLAGSVDVITGAKTKSGNLELIEGPRRTDIHIRGSWCTIRTLPD
jgi:hypothetical protein